MTGTQAGNSSEPTRQRALEPVWTRPAWITAIVGVVSAFLTVPDVVGDYLAKKQDIEIAKQRVTEAGLRNTAFKQEQEYFIINNSLRQQGEERVFMLRYFAATLDDEDARDWAVQEVESLKLLSIKRTQLEHKNLEIENKQAELARRAKTGKNIDDLEADLALLLAEFQKIEVEVSAMQIQAGVNLDSSERGRIRTLVPTVIERRRKLRQTIRDASGVSDELILTLANNPPKRNDDFDVRLRALSGGVEPIVDPASARFALDAALQSLNSIEELSAWEEAIK